MNDQTLPPMATPRVAAGALFFDDEGRVLLVKPSYKEGWDIPGGYVEPGESPKAACEREIREELGIDVKVGRLLVVDWAPAPDEGDKLLFVFESSLTSPSLLRLGEEIEMAEFVSPPRLGQFLTDRLVRRVAAGELANARSNAYYLEHGAILRGMDTRD